MTGGTGIALAGLGTIAALAFVTWLASLARHDVSLVDRMWPVFIAAAAVVYAVPATGSGERMAWLLGLVVAWAARLGLYLTARNWGRGEDRRYQAIRARNEPHFALKSLYLVFGLQAVLAWIVSAPLLAGMTGARELGPLDVAGLALAAFGIAYEAIADRQMGRFQADPANRGRVMDRGLWGTTRHPNYFGEACVWWGVWLVAMSAGGLGAAWSVVSPLLMTVLLLKVSGVGLLEKDIAERRPAYRDYIARTPAFVPGWPRSPGRAH